MNKADKYLQNTITKILEEGITDENPRPKYEDGTPAYSKFITQQVFNFNISKGEFPISTLRNGSLKLAFQEMKTIFINQSNKEEDFVKNGITWWTPWMNESGNLGAAYSFNLESGIREDDVKVVELIDLQINDFTKYDIKVNELLEGEGEIYENGGHPFKVIDKRAEKTPNGQYKYKMQFLNTGAIKVMRGNDLHRALKKGIIIKDPCGLTTYNIGYVIDRALFKEYPTERIRWRTMLKRCYHYKNNKNYESAQVEPRWHVFDNFIEDLKYVPNYFLAKQDNFKGWEIDKDYFSNSKVYSRDTVTFLPSRHNAIYARGGFLELLDECQNIIKYYTCYKDAEKDLNVGGLSSGFYRQKKKGRDFLELSGNLILRRTTKTLRYRNSKNQVIELLKNIENDRFSRRHMLSFFNWREQDDKQLVECAFQSLFSVRVVDDINFIDQTLIQRSSDFIVAGMINSVQYVMLGMIICNHLKYRTGENWQLGNFIWFVQNCHMYDRHLEQAQELLERESTGVQPKLELICEPKDFFKHTWEDFKVSGIEGIEKLSKKLEIAL